MKNETYMSFYLKSSRIHIFIDSLRALGNPRRICFMISEDGNNLLMMPYKKRDLKSHAVPLEVYNGTDCMEISSQRLSRILADRHQWNPRRSYRVPGIIYPNWNVAVFALREAEIIDAINSGE